MSIRPGTYFRQLLLAQSAITDLVGTRIMDQGIDSDTPSPAVGYSALPGEGWVENEITQVTFGVHCWGGTRDASYSLWEAIKNTILEGTQHDIGGVNIAVIEVEDGNTQQTDTNDFNTQFCEGRIKVIMDA